jgi:hypothetical protein
MFGGMLIFGGITAANMAAAQAQAKVDPAIADLHALLTYILVRTLDLDLLQMTAAFSHNGASF